MIGKAIYDILSGASELTAIVGTKMYPVVMPEKTTAPCVVWQVDQFLPEYTKSGTPYDTSDVSIMVFSDDYAQVLTMLSVVRTYLENVRGVYNTVKVAGARLGPCREGYDREADLFFYEIKVNFKHSE